MNKKTGHISFSASVYIYYITGKRGEEIMMEPSRGKWKTPSRAFWRFFGQIAGSLGVFFSGIEHFSRYYAKQFTVAAIFAGKFYCRCGFGTGNAIFF